MSYIVNNCEPQFLTVLPKVVVLRELLSNECKCLKNFKIEVTDLFVTTFFNNTLPKWDKTKERVAQKRSCLEELKHHLEY